MMSEYKISRSAYYAIFRDFEPKLGHVPTHAKSSRGVAGEVREIFEKRLFVKSFFSIDSLFFL